MNVFLSYSQHDKDFAEWLAGRLKEANHKVWFDKWALRVGDNLLNKIESGLKGADALIVIVSKASLRSKWVMKEYSALALGDISGRELKIIPVLIDGSSMPDYLARYLYVDLTQDREIGLGRILDALGTSKKKKAPRALDRKRNYDNAIKQLSLALSAGNLTLVCGAGVSIGAGVPSWNDLLMNLLESMMDAISQNHSISLKGAEAQKFHDKYGPSSLVVGKYLKSHLGSDFLPKLRDALYSTNPSSCEMIDAIVDLSRPQRDGKPLDSIITFNFDGLIEENLAASHIKFKAISQEGERTKPSELPIYHVHGYLPRKGRIKKDDEIVFSEDAYHGQFIDPFSWSNLIQLNKLSQNVCLFVGLSLSDPNMRRLLDVANRKNPSSALSHYIIKKSPSTVSSGETVDELAHLLEEQDANELGLNVIWVDDYVEIAPLIRSLSASEA